MEVQSIKGIIDTTLTAAFSDVRFESGFFRTHMMWHIFPTAFRFLYTACACLRMKYIHRWCRAVHHFGRVWFCTEEMCIRREDRVICVQCHLASLYTQPLGTVHRTILPLIKKSKRARLVCIAVLLALSFRWRQCKVWPPAPHSEDSGENIVTQAKI